LARHHALDQLTEKDGIGGSHIVNLGLITKAMVDELADYLIEVALRQTHLIERLDRGEARLRASNDVRSEKLRRAATHGTSSLNVRAWATRARHARTASA